MRPPRERIPGIVTALVAGLAVVVAFGATISYGFHYDDYHVVRPWSTAELRSVLIGTWDPLGIERPFYRPLTAWWYAARFDLFGLNAWAQHALTLAGTALAAWLVGLFAWRETGERWLAPLGALLYAIHPALAYSQVAWLTNQMHLLASLAVLAALLVWQRAREGSRTAWAVVLLIQVVAFGIKEDTIMLAPLLVALTFVRARFVAGAARPSVTVILAAAAVCAGLIAVRHLALGTIGGYGVPSLPDAWSNFRRGLNVFTLTPADRPWQLAASIATSTLLVAGLVAGFLRRAPAGTGLLLLGLLTALAFNLPFALVTKAEQLHLVTLGAALAMCGACLSLTTTFRAAPVRLAASAIFGVMALTMVPVTRDIARDFEPCAPTTLQTDDYVDDWGVVPGEIRRWLSEKPAWCRTGTPPTLVQALPLVVFAHGLESDERGDPFRWTSDLSAALIRREFETVEVAVRRPDASPATPIDVTIVGPAGWDRVRLTSGDWATTTVALVPGVRSWLRGGAHRVDVHVSPTFVPREIDPASPDTRRLGVQMRIGVR